MSYQISLEAPCDEPQALRTGVSHLRHMKYVVMVLHVFDPVERDLSLPGELLLVDMETGERLPLASRCSAK